MRDPLTRREVARAGAGAALAAYGLAGCGIGRGIRGDVNRVIEPKVDGDLYYFNYSQYMTAAGNGSGAAKYAVRETVPHFADTELRRGLE